MSLFSCSLRYVLSCLSSTGWVTYSTCAAPCSFENQFLAKAHLLSEALRIFARQRFTHHLFARYADGFSINSAGPIAGILCGLALSTLVRTADQVLRASRNGILGIRQ